MLLYCTSILSRLPLRVHYRIADWILFPLIYYVLRYRRKIVDKNLCNSFPEKSEEERRQIRRAFYHEFCDIIVEIIYGYRLSAEEWKACMEFRNMDEMNRLVDAAGGGIIMFSHMGNWEWLASAQLWLSPDTTLVKVYRELKNKSFDQLMLDIRKPFGGIYVEKRRVLREMVRFRSAGMKVLLGLNSDQKPRPEVTRTWVTFLHQETGFVDGGEVLARKYNVPVFFSYLIRDRRGHYISELRLLSAHPQETEEGEITKAYARELERNIKDHPELWLWSHNRWKWKREERKGKREE